MSDLAPILAETALGNRHAGSTFIPGVGGSDVSATASNRPIQPGGLEETPTLSPSGQYTATMRDTTMPTSASVAFRESSAALSPDLGEVRLPRPLPLPNLLSKEYVVTTVDWEGYVERVDRDGFTARLLERGAIGAERTKVLFDEVSSFDMPLIKEGAVFYWTLGYRVRESKQRETMSLIRFRRLPSWTTQELNELEVTAGEHFHELGWADDQDGGPV